MARYAQQTTVSTDSSRAEIEHTLNRYGATGFAYAREGDKAMVAFGIQGRRVRFMLPLPDQQDRAFTHTRTGRERGRGQYPHAVLKAWEQACRQRWRALALCIKAKLEAVEAGIVTFDEEFLAHIVLPGGQTFGEQQIPHLDEALAGRPMPPLLTMGGN